MTLKELRKSIGATQENVAWKCKVHREAVSMWERGVKRPTRRHMITMSKFFMVPIETIEAAVEMAMTERQGKEG